jgi:hypothetical protein
MFCNFWFNSGNWKSQKAHDFSTFEFSFLFFGYILQPNKRKKKKKTDHTTLLGILLSSFWYSSYLVHSVALSSGNEISHLLHRA